MLKESMIHIHTDVSVYKRMPVILAKGGKSAVGDSVDQPGGDYVEK